MDRNNSWFSIIRETYIWTCIFSWMRIVTCILYVWSWRMVDQVVRYQRQDFFLVPFIILLFFFIYFFLALVHSFHFCIAISFFFFISPHHPKYFAHERYCSYCSLNRDNQSFPLGHQHYSFLSAFRCASYTSTLLHQIL